MRYLLPIVFMLFTSITWAAPPTTFTWDRNTESDVDHYNVFTCSTSATCMPNANIGTVPQPAIGTSPSFLIPANSQGRAAVTAVDLVGNESGQSNIASWDKQPPGNPLNLRTQ